jgi:hypothetical protein
MMTQAEIDALLDIPGVYRVQLSTGFDGTTRTTLTLDYGKTLMVNSDDRAVVAEALAVYLDRAGTVLRDQAPAEPRLISQTQERHERIQKLHLLITLVPRRPKADEQAWLLLKSIAADLGLLSYDQACGELRALLYPGPEPEPAAARVAHSIGRELEFEEERMALEDMRERRAAGEPK